MKCEWQAEPGQKNRHFHAADHGCGLNPVRRDFTLVCCLRLSMANWGGGGLPGLEGPFSSLKAPPACRSVSRPAVKTDNGKQHPMKQVQWKPTNPKQRERPERIKEGVTRPGKGGRGSTKQAFAPQRGFQKLGPPLSGPCLKQRPRGCPAFRLRLQPSFLQLPELA